MREAVFVKVQAVPSLKQIEQCEREGEPHLEICPHPLAEMLELADLRQEREERFDQHAVVPLAPPTNFQVPRRIAFAAEAFVGQNDHLPLDGLDQRQEFLIRDVRRLQLPTGHEPELVRQDAQFPADDPLPGGEPFAPDAPAVRLMALADRVSQLDAVRIDHAEQRRLSQKRLGQSPVRPQTPEKAGPVRQTGEQIDPVLPGKAVKRALGRTLESHQQTERHEFAQGKLGLDVFAPLRQHIVHPAIKFCDKVFLSHATGPPCVWFRHLHIRDFSVTFSTSTNG